MGSFKHKLMGGLIALCFVIALPVMADVYGDMRTKFGIEADTDSDTYPGFKIDGSEIWGTASSVSLTSPTVTFAVPQSARLVTLNSDANQTGIYPTGGTTGQVITVISGTGSNTMQFDDGANTILGANVVLTEGQSDVLTLYFNGTAWVGVSAHDN